MKKNQFWTIKVQQLLGISDDIPVCIRSVEVGPGQRGEAERMNSKNKKNKSFFIRNL